MIVEVGHYALVLALAIALMQTILPFWGARARDARLMAVARPTALTQFAFVALSYAALTYAHVASDFSLANVVENSNSNMPLVYRISGVWGNHEGSMMLWVLILTLSGAAMAVFSRSIPPRLLADALSMQGLLGAAFLLFILLTSNPFARLSPAPLEGADLNPILQDPGLAIHPPLLYLGYVGFSIVFSLAAAALIGGRIDAAFARFIRPWTLAAWCFLTLGIAMGSYWAYYTLGWGGFWFWDPVENASLLPWLAGTALLHSAAVMEKRDALKIWTIFLAILTFSLSLLGTFLVRSGVLTSVHAFASDPQRGLFILAILVLFIGGSLFLFMLRAPTLSKGGLFAPVSREGALVLNNILLCSICAVVVVGTMYPPFADLLLGQKISVGAPFFNATVLPLAIPLFAAMAVGPLLPWKRAKLMPIVEHAWWAALAAVIVTGACTIGMKILPALAFGFATWIILGSFAEVVERVLLFRTPVASSFRRARGLPIAVLGAAIAPAGMGGTLAGLAGAALDSQKIVSAKVGQTFSSGGYEWTLMKLEDADGPNYTSRMATIYVKKDGVPVVLMHPSRRNFTAQHQTTSDVAISTNLLRDLYAVLGEEHDGQAVLRLHVNVLAPWIWLGAFTMAIGGAISLSDRRLRVGAPSRARPDAVTA